MGATCQDTRYQCEPLSETWGETKEEGRREGHLVCRLGENLVKWDGTSKGRDHYRSWSVCIPVNQAGKDGHRNDPEIEGQTPVLQVVQVALNALFDRRVAAPTVDLRPTGNSDF